MNELHIYIDGVVAKESNKWGYVVGEYDLSETKISDMYRGEFIDNTADKEFVLVVAFKECLEFLKEKEFFKKKKIYIYLDSPHVKELLSRWIFKWAKEDFVNGDTMRPNYIILTDIHELLESSQKIVNIKLTYIKSHVIKQILKILSDI